MTSMQRSSTTALLSSCAMAILLCFAAIGCSSVPPLVLDASPAQTYQAMLHDKDRSNQTDEAVAATAIRQQARYDEMARRVTQMELTTAEEFFYAGAILVRSNQIDHLLLAESVGRKATILGDRRGRPVAAEAVDRQAFVNGTEQTFGTQYAFNVITATWELYPYNKETTDADRDAVGLPPLSWFEDRVRELNESEKTEVVRRELDSQRFE